MRGLFIVFEGIDRSGKSTQVAELLQKLKEHNIPAVGYKFPNRDTPIGKIIDSYLKKQTDLSDKTVELLFSANRFEFQDDIRNKLNSGITVIADRYVFSGIVYGDNYLEIEKELIAPDLVIYLDIKPVIAVCRDNFGSELYENIDKQKRVKNNYEKFKDLEFWISIDGIKEIKTISNHVWDIVQFKLLTHEPIRYLKNYDIF